MELVGKQMSAWEVIVNGKHLRNTRGYDNFRLKILIDSDDWISIGSLFHSNGAALLKALSLPETNFEVCVLSK